MALVDVRSIPQVPLTFVNDDHGEEARLLNDLAEALEAFRSGGGSGERVEERLDALHAHTREHFAREEQAMLQSGFPPYPMHKGEHDRVLAEMAAEERRFRESHDAARLWSYVSQIVPTWFVGHIRSMDLATAQFVAASGAA